MSSLSISNSDRSKIVPEIRNFSDSSPKTPVDFENVLDNFSSSHPVHPALIHIENVGVTDLSHEIWSESGQSLRQT